MHTRPFFRRACWIDTVFLGPPGTFSSPVWPSHRMDLPMGRKKACRLFLEELEPRLAPSVRPDHVVLVMEENHSFRSEEHTSELQSHSDLVCRLLLEKKKKY